MFRLNKFSRLLILALVILSACSKEDPKLPKPVIDFNTDPLIVEVGKAVTFENLSLNAAGYVWDFGDGQTSTDVSPTITYDESDTYSVKLLAYTQDNQKDSLIKEIFVGQRILTGLFINSIPFVNEDGADWDDPTDQPDSVKFPDFILVMG
ncbi:MAG TPA: PKD domain-containing protein, partial [Cyclobacteriaceae bacterium]|nr:PKD domain-containing protein [Cyclobacteriaceae bacterium]